MISGPRTWRAQLDMHRDGVDLLAKLPDGPNGERRFVKFEESVSEYAEHASSRDAYLSLSCHEAQGLMNALWDAGVRPRGGQGAVAHVQGLESHISDLRKIAFNALGVSK